LHPLYYQSYKLISMMKRLLIIICLINSIFQVEATYTGRVFIDKNKNGIADKDDKALENVMVSDGLHVVKTAADGSFRLPGHSKERFIFITTPSGYKTDNRHYIPIDKERTIYNFGLQPYDGGIQKDGKHTFIHISDTEIFNTDRHEDWINNLRDYARNESAAFIIHTGDICYEKGLREHITLMNTNNMGCPVFYCIGNHDLIKGTYGEALYEEIYGPVFYSFEAGNTHYIVTPMLEGDYTPSYTKEDVYQWLQNDLRQVPLGKPVILFNHDLFTHSEMINLNMPTLKAWIYGHRHMNYMKKQGDVYTICTNSLDKGGIDHSTAAFRVIDVDHRGNVSSRLRYTYLDKHLEIATPGNDGFPVSGSGSVPLTVNVYHSSSPVKEVVYTCYADGKRLFSKQKLAQKTDWTWKENVPLGHQPTGKAITIRVTATFRNGETAEKEVRFIHASRKPQTYLKDNWTNLLNNPEHNGVSSSSAITPPLKMAWTTNLGANVYMTSPIIYKGKIFIASVDENLKGQAFIYALNGQTGEIVWKYAVHNSIKNTIAVEDDLVFAQTAQGSLYALKTEDGSLKWGKQLLVDGMLALTEGLVVSNGVVYAGTGNGLYALNAQTGERIWQNKGWRQGEGATATLTLGKGMLIGSSQWKGLYGNDAQTGELKWHLSRSGINNRGASATIHENLLYITAGKSLFIIDPLTGNIAVRKEYPFSVDVTSTPLLTDKEIIFGSANNGLIAVDKETLDIKWQYQTEDALVYTSPYTRKPSATIETSPVLSGDIVYFGASDGTLYGVNKENGALVWKHATGAPVFGSVALSGNTLVAADFGGNIYTFVTQ
jgi:outer membrane protein assembly factor BamB/predicted phosphodiesterase